MRKALLTLTIGVVAVAAAVMAIAGITAPQTSATSSLCHSSTLSITAPKTATAGKSVTVTGGEPQAPAHSVTATLQYKKATATAWKNGASANLSSSGSYSLKWKAPSVKGKYKVRVRVVHSSASSILSGEDRHRQVGLAFLRVRPPSRAATARRERRKGWWRSPKQERRRSFRRLGLLAPRGAARELPGGDRSEHVNPLTCPSRPAAQPRGRTGRRDWGIVVLGCGP